MRLTLLDVASTDIIGTARLVEGLGFHRYWSTEHHTPGECASPIVAMAAVAASTSRIRVGTAGIMLAYATPQKLAEDFAMMSRLFGSHRLDLGVIGAMVRGPLGEQLLDGRPPPTNESYEARVEAVATAVRASQAVQRPELWVCGQSARSARIAAAVDASYAFHHYLNIGPKAVDGPRVVDEYRQTRRGAAAGARTCIVCCGYCATDHDARAYWEHVMPGRIGPGPAGSPPPSFIGTPQECREQILELTDRYGADDVAVEIFAPSHAMRLQSLRLLADALHRDVT